MDKKTRDTIIQYVIIFAVLCALAYFAYCIGREDARSSDDNGGEETPQEVGPAPASPVSGVAVPVQRQEAPAPMPVAYEPTPAARQNGHVAPVADGSPYRAPGANESLAPLVPESLE